MPLRSTLSCDFVRLSRLSYHHPERNRGIFVAAVFLIHTLIRFHETPYPPMHGKTGFPFWFTRIHRLTANEKDFSLSLEMTVRGRIASCLTRERLWCGDAALPPSYGRRCPEGAEVGSRSGINTSIFTMTNVFRNDLE